MYARVTTFRFDPARSKEVATTFQELKAQAKALPGIANAYSMWRPDGQGMVVAIYRDKASADAAAAKIQALWSSFSALLKGTPNVEFYDSVEHMTG
jgi:quinol monooxygenase YgiN